MTLGKLFLSVVCLYLCQFAFPITPLLPSPCKYNSRSQPVREATAASDIQRLAQGGAGPADGADSGKSDTRTANLFRNERPQENALQGASTKTRELR